jgi:hypothetical protein
MFNSTILDVMVGLAFVFLVVSLIASAVTEGLASLLQLRSSTLLTGMKALFNDQDGAKLVNDLYNHALINPRDQGGHKNTGELTSLPAYIDPTQFADAMIEINSLGGEATDIVKQRVSGSDLSGQTKTLLLGMVDRAQGDTTKLRNELAGWFDSAMDRVGGVYKRKAQLIGLIAAAAIAIGLNIDTVRIAKALWLQPMMTKSIDDTKFASTDDAFTKLEGLGVPMGWSIAATPDKGGSTIDIAADASMVIGWLITIIASLFGAPFWYDMLQSFVRIKGSGPSPAEKAAGSGASA